MASHFFGPLGSMAEITVSAGVATATARGFSEFVSSGGVRHVQRGRAAPRTWVVGRLYQEPWWVRLLSLAAHGLLPQCWLYDVAEARENMVPAQLSAGNGAYVVVAGSSIRAVAQGHEVKVPVLAGRLYTVSAWSSTLAVPVLTWQVGDGAAAQLSTLGGLAEASFTPTADTILTVKVTAANVAGLRVHDGAPDGNYFATSGTPVRVAVADPERALQMVTEQVRSDYQVTLLEVGKAGTL